MTDEELAAIRERILHYDGRSESLLVEDAIKLVAEVYSQAMRITVLESGLREIDGFAADVVDNAKLQKWPDLYPVAKCQASREVVRALLDKERNDGAS